MAKAQTEGWRQRMARLCRLRTVRRLYADDAGSAGVELAFVAIPFLMILAAIFETSMFLWAGQTLDTATTAASRLILTGQAQISGMTKEQFKEKLCSYVIALIDCKQGVMIDVQAYASWDDVTIGKPVDSDGNVTATGEIFQIGNPKSIVVVRAVYQYPLLLRSFGINLADLANGKRVLVSTVAFQNEPYQATTP
jgi:Flp pilus assembly protein TadG